MDHVRDAARRGTQLLGGLAGNIVRAATTSIDAAVATGRRAVDLVPGLGGARGADEYGTGTEPDGVAGGRESRAGAVAEAPSPVRTSAEEAVAASNATERGWSPDDVSAGPSDELPVPEEVELVAEFAETGADEGPGPNIEIAEPWDGYGRMKVAEIVKRLDGATPAEAGAVELYESAHRGRKGVLQAAERALKTSA